MTRPLPRRLSSLAAAVVALLALTTASASATVGQLRAQTNYPSGAVNPRDVATGDFDGDGVDDVAVANYGTGYGNGRVTVSLSDRQGRLQAPTAVSSAGDFSYLAVADFNTDGLDDIVADAYSSIVVLINDGDGTFTETAINPGNDTLGVATGDFDGDGKADFVVGQGGYGGGIRVSYGDGADGFPDERVFGSGGNLGELGAGDLNADGLDDVLVSTNNGQGLPLRVYLADDTATGSRGFKPAIDDTRFDRPTSIVTGYIDDDHDLDIAAATNGGWNGYVALGNGDGTFAAPAGYGDSYGGVALADLDHDGRDEVLRAKGGLEVRSPAADGTLGFARTYTTGGGSDSVATGDFDGDGFPDVVTNNNNGSNTISVLLNEGESANLSITNTDDADPVLNGQHVTYTLTARNDGPDAATNVEVADELPKGLEFVSASDACVFEKGDATVTPPQPDRVFCHAGRLPAKDDPATDRVVENEASFEVVATATGAGSVTNLAAVAGDQPDPSGDDDTDSETTAIAPAAGLSVAVADSADPAERGQQLTYTLTATNAGPDAASGVELSDTLPAGVQFVGAAPGCTNTSGVVTCSVGALPSGASTSRTISVRPTGLGGLSNTATASADTGDPDSADNSDTEQTTVQDTTKPSIAITEPTDMSTSTYGTPAFFGLTGNAPGDGGTVTVRVYTGHAASADALPATPLRSVSVPHETNGTWGATIAPTLPSGQYTARAEQSDDAGNTGYSELVRFTIKDAPPTFTDIDGDGRDDSRDRCPRQPASTADGCPPAPGPGGDPAAGDGGPAADVVFKPSAVKLATTVAGEQLFGPKGVTFVVFNPVDGSVIKTETFAPAAQLRGLQASAAASRLKLIGSTTVKGAKAGKVKVRAKVGRKAAKRLRKRRSLKLTVRVTLTPPGGVPSVVTKTIRVKNKRRRG